MSFRLLGHRLFQHGRQFVYNNCIKRKIHFNILDHTKNRGVTRQFGLAAKVSSKGLFFLLFPFRQSQLQNIVDNFLYVIYIVVYVILKNKCDDVLLMTLRMNTNTVAKQCQAKAHHSIFER